MPTPQKVLHVITGLSAGGAERSLYNLVCKSRHAFATQVVSLGGMDFYGHKLRELGVDVHCLNMKPPIPSIHAFGKLNNLLKRNKPDIIQGWMYHGNLAATLGKWATQVRTPVAWNIRHSLYDIAKEKLATRVVVRANRKSSKRASSIIYNSDTSRSQHETFGYCATKSLVIPNGFDTEQWRPDPEKRAFVRQELGLDHKDRAVALVARYHPMKDIPSFLKAMATLMDTNKRLHCVLAGSGLDRSNHELAQRLSSLPNDRVHMLGLRDDISSLMAGMDVLCLSSAWGEGFPNVVGEAMATGLPCVTTDVGDCRSIVGNTGSVVLREDPDALASALAKLVKLEDNDLRSLGMRARQRIIENFGLSATVNAYHRHYHQLTDA